MVGKVLNYEYADSAGLRVLKGMSFNHRPIRTLHARFMCANVTPKLLIPASPSPQSEPETLL